MSDTLFTKYGKTFQPNDTIFKAGEIGKEIFVIRSGSVRIFVESRGVNKTLAVLGPGEIIGEMALLNNRPRSATAVALEESELLLMSMDVFEEMIIHNTEIAVRLIRKLSKRLETADSLIQVLLIRDPKERIIENFKRLAKVRGWTPDRPVTLGADMEAMAEQVGLEVAETQDIVSRMIRAGALTEKDGSWVIPDPSQLDDFLKFIKEKEKFH